MFFPVQTIHLLFISNCPGCRNIDKLIQYLTSDSRSQNSIFLQFPSRYETPLYCSLNHNFKISSPFPDSALFEIIASPDIFLLRRRCVCIITNHTPKGRFPGNFFVEEVKASGIYPVEKHVHYELLLYFQKNIGVIYLNTYLKDVCCNSWYSKGFLCVKQTVSKVHVPITCSETMVYVDRTPALQMNSSDVKILKTSASIKGQV